MRFRKDTYRGLPEGRQFALTWEISDNFGGLTKAMLQRSTAFAETAGTPVSILTFSLQTDLDAVRADLKTRGLLGEGVTISNLWEDLKALSDEELRQAPVDPEYAEPQGDPAWVRILRGDGTVVATQLWARAGTAKPMCEFGDYVVETALWARGGAFIGGWHGSWGLWNFWMGRRMDDPDSYAIIDSSVIGDFMVHRDRGRATTLYLFHNNHLARRREPPYAPLDRWRRYVSEHHADFDANVFLTETQRLDFGRLMGSVMGSVDNTHTVPNIVTGSTPLAGVVRIEDRGVILARFSPQKRLEHALRAIATAAQSHPGIHLDVYGTGPREPELRALAAELDGPIVFHGYTESPALEFARSSFSLLTSTHEGLGLSVIESMAAGCVPLSYDVPYGPSNIITHGVDGFLVPAGDHRAMATQIGEFLDLDPRAVKKMRAAGRKRAEAFAAKPIIGMWGDAMRTARGNDAAPKGHRATEQLSARERRAALTRFASTTAHAELIDASWLDETLLQMTARVHLTGDEDAAGAQYREVLAKLIHRPTGAVSPMPLSCPPGLVQPDDPPGSRYVVMDVDVNQLPDDLDHAFLLGLTCEGDLAWDIIGSARPARDWLAFPAASANRPVLVLDNKRGVELVGAAPKVAATAAAEGDGVALWVETLVGKKLEAVEATGLKGAPTVQAERDDSGVYRLQLPGSGLWEVRATVDGTSRLVAWGSTSEELNDLDGVPANVSIGASPRGYLRLSAAPTEAAPSP